MRYKPSGLQRCRWCRAGDSAGTAKWETGTLQAGRRCKQGRSLQRCTPGNEGCTEGKCSVWCPSIHTFHRQVCTCPRQCPSCIPYDNPCIRLRQAQCRSCRHQHKLRKLVEQSFSGNILFGNFQELQCLGRKSTLLCHRLLMWMLCSL